MRIVIDAMGGDNAPSQIIKGAVEGLSLCKADVVLVGNEEAIEAELENYEYDKQRISVINASEVITNDESPVFALRRKKDSSIVRALEAVKGDGDSALISAGSTGATLAGGLLLCGRIKGIERPALATALPGKNGPVLLVDSGANVDCDVKHLLGFAFLGRAYMESVFGIDNPKIGLINNGAEEHKGNNLTKAAYQELKKHTELNFVGNVEPRYVYDNQADVLVCDGFAGNAILKTSEGIGLYMMSSLKEEIKSRKISMLGALLMKKSLKGLKNRFNYDEYGGAPLLGVEANIIKIHGSSKSTTVKYAMLQAEKMIEGNVVGKIRNTTESLIEKNEEATK